MALYEDSSLLCQDPEDEGTVILYNTVNLTSPNNTLLHL